MSPILIKIFDALPKIVNSIAVFFFPSKLKEAQIRVRRLSVTKMNEVEEFIDLYRNSFPDDGTNYTDSEILELLEDIKNERKHVEADNIIVIAQSKDTLIGFVICHYYPARKYGIISYFAKDKNFKDEGKYAGTKLLRKLKDVLIEKHKCELIVFQLQINEKDKAKFNLFKLYAKSLGLEALKINFDYVRPKMKLTDLGEENLILVIVPISLKIRGQIAKERLIDILDFIHVYCYGDFYDQGTNEFYEYHDYLKERVRYYANSLSPDIFVR